MSRILEQTFRNFQLHARRPSHMDPPFPARPIDVFVPGRLPVVVGIGATVTVITFTMPVGRWRGEVVKAGQEAEAPAAFADLEWTIRVDGIPHFLWRNIGQQLWQMVPPT
jgi:hypothetical protein